MLLALIDQGVEPHGAGRGELGRGHALGDV